MQDAAESAAVEVQGLYKIDGVVDQGLFPSARESNSLA